MDGLGYPPTQWWSPTRTTRTPTYIFWEGAVLGDKGQGVGIRDKTWVEFYTEDQVLFFSYSSLCHSSTLFLQYFYQLKENPTLSEMEDSPTQPQFFFISLYINYIFGRLGYINLLFVRSINMKNNLFLYNSFYEQDIWKSHISFVVAGNWQFHGCNILNRFSSLSLSH